MILVYLTFGNEIIEIKNQISYIEDLKSDILKTSKSYSYSITNSKKKFEYNSLIISLYGIVESNCEKLIKRYLEKIQDSILIYDYNDKKLIENHFILSLKLTTLINDNKNPKYNHLSKEDVVLKLNNCIINKPNYIFNEDAFSINTGNLKHSKVCELFNVLGINFDEEIRKHAGFTVRTENMFNILDDLVERRNEIAHGGSLSDILDNSIILSYVEFVERYISAIIAVLELKFENEFCKFKKDLFSIEIDKIDVQSGTLLGIIDGKKYNLSIDDEILIEKANSFLVSSKIEGYREFQGSDDVVIKLVKPIKKNQKFFIFDRVKYNTFKGV